LHTLENDRKLVVVVLPAYNEASTISATIEAFHRELPESLIIVVNNNSRDDTAERALATFKALGCSGEVIHERRQGKGNAMRRAFLEVDADIYLLADADLTYPAFRSRDLIKPVIDGAADMVVGDRISGGHYAHENHRMFHGFGNRLVRSLVNRLFDSNLVDVMSGYRVMSRRFIKNYPVMVDGFQIETDLSLHALDKRYRIVEIPIEYQDRPAGSHSKLRTVADGVQVIWLIIQILRHFKPLQFFGSLAIVCCLAGLAAATPVMTDWINYRFIHHLPLAILATGCEIVAVMMLSVGLVLDSLVHLQRIAYEHMVLTYTDTRRN
jgi:glycosyltransferase involved in cell wall biosynthesis